MQASRSTLSQQPHSLPRLWTALQPSGGQWQENVERFGCEVPLGHPGQPVELAPVYVFLASQQASYVTGEVYGTTDGNGTA